MRRRTLTWRRLWRAGPGLKVQKSDFECGHDDYGHDFYDVEDGDGDEKDEVFSPSTNKSCEDSLDSRFEALKSKYY